MNQVDAKLLLNLLICEQRCSDAFRQMAETNDWMLLEGAKPIAAARTSAAIGPDRVCIEIVRSTAIAPDIVRRLGAMDAVGHVACLMANPTPRLEADLARAGASTLTTIREAESWLRGVHNRPHTDPPRSQPRPRFRVVTREQYTQHSGFR